MPHRKNIKLSHKIKRILRQKEILPSPLFLVSPGELIEGIEPSKIQFPPEVLKREVINTLDRSSDEDKHEEDSELQCNETIEK